MNFLITVKKKKIKKDKKWLNAKLEHQLAGPHALWHEVSAYVCVCVYIYIYIYIYIDFIGQILLIALRTHLRVKQRNIASSIGM